MGITRVVDSPPSKFHDSWVPQLKAIQMLRANLMFSTKHRSPMGMTLECKLIICHQFEIVRRYDL